MRLDHLRHPLCALTFATASLAARPARSGTGHISSGHRPGMTLIVRAHRAYALHRAGRIDAAIDAFDRCIADLEHAQMRPHLALARVRRAALRRQLGHDPAVGLAVIDAAATVFAEVEDPMTHGALACERGHHRLALGLSASGSLERARVCFARLRITHETPTLLGWMLSWLADAQTAFEAGHALRHGQIWQTVYPGVRAWLMARDGEQLGR